MSIHDEIMNIQIDIHKQLDATCNHSGIAYKMGHRDVRQQAAEISLRYELELQKLKDELDEKTQALREIALYKRVTSEGDHFCCAEDELAHKEEIAEAVLQVYNNI